MEPRKSFEDLADRLADGQDVDWKAAESDASVEERDLIKNLRLIQDVSRVAKAEDPSVFLGPVPGVSKPAAPKAEGSTWGQLQLLEEIGSGSFGTVHRAWDPMLNRQVALKLLNDRAAELPDAGKRVLEEARMLAKIEHPGVVRIYGIEEHDGQLGIWMEFVEGTDLNSVMLERGRFEAIDAAKIVAELCDAVAAVHDSNVVHKDIKAANVMLRTDGRPVLMDFGAGKKRRVREGEPEMVVTGTPRYMAPEAFRREPTTPQSDIYSLGVLLYAMTTGDFPITGTVPEIIDAHENQRLRPITDHGVELPTRFVELVEKAMAPRREDRFASARELSDALKEFATPRTSSGTVGERPVPRRRLLAWSMVAAVAIAGVFTGIRVLQPAGPLDADIRFTGVNEGQFVELEKGAEIGTDTGIELKIRLNQDAYVYVLNRDEQGATTLLWPLMNGGPVEPLKGGREHTIPGQIDDGDPLRWYVAPVEGAERFLIVASVEPMPKFEQAMETAQVSRIDATSFMGVEVGDLAMNSLNEEALPGETTRGVIGMRRAAEDSRDAFAIAEKFGGQSPDGKVLLKYTEFANVGR